MEKSLADFPLVFILDHLEGQKSEGTQNCEVIEASAQIFFCVIFLECVSHCNNVTVKVQPYKGLQAKKTKKQTKQKNLPSSTLYIKNVTTNLFQSFLYDPFEEDHHDQLAN